MTVTPTMARHLESGDDEMPTLLVYAQPHWFQEDLPGPGEYALVPTASREQPLALQDCQDGPLPAGAVGIVLLCGALPFFVSVPTVSAYGNADVEPAEIMALSPEDRLTLHVEGKVLRIWYLPEGGPRTVTSREAGQLCSYCAQSLCTGEFIVLCSNSDCMAFTHADCLAHDGKGWCPRCHQATVVAPQWIPKGFTRVNESKGRGK
jgi:hypothetical protein